MSDVYPFLNLDEVPLPEYDSLNDLLCCDDPLHFVVVVCKIFMGTDGSASMAFLALPEHSSG